MYSVSDAVEVGKADRLILSVYKWDEVLDDFEPWSLPCEELFNPCDGEV